GRRRGRVRGRFAGRDDLLQHLGGSGARPGGPVPAGDDGPVRGAGAVHRAGPGPDAAGQALPAGRHPAGPRAALLGHVGRHQQPGDAAAGRVRRPGAPEGLRRGPGLDHAATAARRDHPGDRQRAVPAHHADRLHARRRSRGRHPGHGRVRLGAAGGHGDLPRRHDPRPPPARAGGRPAAGPRPPPPPRPGPPPPPPRPTRPDFYPNDDGRYTSRQAPRGWDDQPGHDGRTRPYEPAALPPGAVPAGAGPAGTGATGAGPGSANGQAKAGRAAGGRWRSLGNVGPVVGEAMRANAVLRAFSGYMVFFLAFFLRSEHFGVSHNVALGALVAAAAAGGLAAMAIGSLIKSRAPQFMLFAMLTLAPVVTAVCAWFFSLEAAIAVAFTAALAAGIAKLSLDSTVQREIGEEIRSSAFAVSETLNQVANVAGSVAGVLVSMLNNGEVGLAIAAAFLTAALVSLVARRRRRILAAREEQYVPSRRPRPAS